MEVTVVLDGHEDLAQGDKISAHGKASGWGNIHIDFYTCVNPSKVFGGFSILDLRWLYMIACSGALAGMEEVQRYHIQRIHHIGLPPLQILHCSP